MLRVMTIKDYDGAVALWRATPGMGLRSLDDSKEGIEKYLQRNPYTSFVAEESGGIVGTILCGHDGRRGFIYHLAVGQDMRRKGLGTALVEAALGALKQEGINKVCLVVFAQNAIGNAFWQNLGFAARGDLCYRDLSLSDENI